MTTSQRITTSIAALRAQFRVATDDPELVQAQVKALSRQFPLLLFISFVNTVAVIWTYYGVAPDIMTIEPLVLVVIGYSALAWTWVRAGYRPLSHAEACHLLKMTAIQAPVTTTLSLAWALILIRYGDASAQGQIVFTVGIAMVSCIFCQMHLRPAALSVTAVTAIAFVGFFLATRRPVFLVIALSMLLVLAAMVNILIVFTRDFASMIAFQRGLVESQAENARLANTDSLTGLPNRRKFLTTLRQVFGRAASDNRRFVVGLIDLDRFKGVNDLHGHEVGDRVLVEAGRRLCDLCDAKTLVARLGSDEFGVIVDADISDTAVQALGDRIREALEVPFAGAGVTVHVSASAGFAIFPQAGSTAELLFERANYALAYAREHPPGRPTIFSIEHETEIRKLATIEECLRHADLESELSMHFQPIIDVERGEIVAFEALARWVSPILGRVAPDVFIRVAERSDLINELTRTLLRGALAQVATWPAQIRVSFNLSTRDLASREALLGIVAIIQASGVAPGRIDLEVTETALIQDLDQASASLEMLKTLGLGISLDDFGTGYSSLSFVQQFPIDKIKVDRSFVREVETKPACRAIVKSVIDLCRNLQLTCIVEGMETDAQVGVLRALGCTTMQGYLFGKPMPADDIPGFLAAADPPSRLKVQFVEALAS
jgi:diguanylate cyclase (GGDEF)-like protein